MNISKLVGGLEPWNFMTFHLLPIGSMYAIYNGNIYHPYTPNVSIYTIHGSYENGGVRFVCVANIELG